jgi:SsrA-binding protein
MTKKRRQKQPGQVLNRRSSFDYALQEDLVVGLSLTGQEVRAARDGHVQLKGSFVGIKDQELWLTGASFSLKLNEKGDTSRTVDIRARKLLASRKQIDGFIAARQQGMTIVPTKLLTSGRYIKLVIALGKGKKSYDKRQAIKQREQNREASRQMRHGDL